jgi:hypothetical protein
MIYQEIIRRVSDKLLANLEDIINLAGVYSISIYPCFKPQKSNTIYCVPLNFGFKRTFETFPFCAYNSKKIL